MTLRVGVIGTGAIGTSHAMSLATRVAGASVAAVFDVDSTRAGEIARQIGADVATTAEELIDSNTVDAVVIATPGFTHASLVLACIKAEKPTMCEKPLAMTAADCRSILDAESGGGRRLVQVGFMRRFDPGYVQVKAAIEGGRIGDPLVIHCVHRNPSVPAGFGNELIMNDSIVHEFDIARWLLDDEIASVQVLKPRPTRYATDGLYDPQIAIFGMRGGAIATVEVFVNCRYGYDVRCEVVGSDGLANLDTPRLSSVVAAGARTEAVADSWVTRFGDTYRLELQAWVDSVAAGTPVGASAWDGYAATAVADAALLAQRTGAIVPVELIQRPDFYR